jgi:hypothetical protein
MDAANSGRFEIIRGFAPGLAGRCRMCRGAGGWSLKFLMRYLGAAAAPADSSHCFICW